LLEKARHDLTATQEMRKKLVQTLPHYREQEAAYEKLMRDGFVGKLMHTDKQRERIEKERDLRAQEAVIASGNGRQQKSSGLCKRSRRPAAFQELRRPTPSRRRTKLAELPSNHQTAGPCLLKIGAGQQLGGDNENNRKESRDVRCDGRVCRID
jgi:HlyD family secretion protein